MTNDRLKQLILDGNRLQKELEAASVAAENARAAERVAATAEYEHRQELAAEARRQFPGQESAVVRINGASYLLSFNEICQGWFREIVIEDLA